MIYLTPQEVRNYNMEELIDKGEIKRCKHCNHYVEEQDFWESRDIDLIDGTAIELHNICTYCIEKVEEGEPIEACDDNVVEMPDIDEDFESLADDIVSEKDEEEWNKFCREWAEEIKLQEVKDETSTV